MTPTSLAQGNGPSGSGEIGFQRGFTNNNMSMSAILVMWQEDFA